MIIILILIIFVTCIFVMLDSDFTIRKLLIHLIINVTLFLVYTIIFILIVVCCQ
jgi:hypothetical protein